MVTLKPSMTRPHSVAPYHYGWISALFLLGAAPTIAVADDHGGAVRKAPAAMVVIGPERFHRSMAGYLAHRQVQRPTEWASLESVLKESQSVDDPERLKRWITEPGASVYHQAEHLETLKPNNDWYPPSIFFQGMKYMVFGDPALRLPGSRTRAERDRSPGRQAPPD